jgi:hypothetical protein
VVGLLGYVRGYTFVNVVTGSRIDYVGFGFISK